MKFSEMSKEQLVNLKKEVFAPVKMEKGLYEVKLRYIDEKIAVEAYCSNQAEELAIAHARNEYQIPEDEEIEVSVTIQLC